MNRPCKINFHDDAAPIKWDLPDRYQANATIVGQGIDTVRSLLVQHAFYVDFAPEILRTRVGNREDNPVDFPMSSVSHIEWFYSDTPSPLVPFVDNRKN